jgi:hypothetical protein
MCRRDEVELKVRTNTINEYTPQQAEKDVNKKKPVSPASILFRLP